MHAVSLEHHRSIDAASRDWFHICDLCKVKVGPLQNYVDHVGGRKHQNALGMHQRTHSSEGKKKQQPNLKQKKVKLTVKGKEKPPLKGSINGKVKAKQPKASAKQSAKPASTSVAKKKAPSTDTPKEPPTEGPKNGADQRKRSASAQNSDKPNSKEEEASKKAKPEEKPKRKPIDGPPGSSGKPVAVTKVKKSLVKPASSSKPVAAKKTKKASINPPSKPVAVKKLKKRLACPPSDGEAVVKRPKKLPAEPPSISKLLDKEEESEGRPVDSPDSGKPESTAEQPTEAPVECDTSSSSGRRSSRENNVAALSEVDGNDMYSGNWGNSHGCYPLRPNGRGRGPFMVYRGGRGRGPWHGGAPPFQPPFGPYGGPRPFNRFAGPMGMGVPPWAANYGFNSYGGRGGQGGSWHHDSYDDDRWQFTSAGHGYGDRNRDDRASESLSHDEPGAADGSDEATNEPSQANSSLSADGHRGRSSRPASPASSTKSQRSDKSLSKTSRRSPVEGSANGNTTGRRKSGTGEKNSSSTGAQIEKNSEDSVKSKSKAKASAKSKGSEESLKSKSKDPVKEKRAPSAGKRPLLPCPLAGASSDTDKTTKAVERPKIVTTSSEKPGASRDREQRTRVLRTVSVSPGLAKQRQSLLAKEAATSSPDRGRTEVAIKKEVFESAEDAAEDAAGTSSKGSHLIFLSSEDEDHDSDGKHKSSKSEAGARATQKLAKKAKSGGSAGAPSTPEREAALSKSPRIGSTSTKDMYRRDVLDKLVNFPSSRQVQTQLNKWMMEMQKHQKSVSWRQTLRLCSTQARVEREEDPLSTLPNIDLDVLLRQVEACELPEEMLQSLMQALSTPDITAAEEAPFPPPSIAASAPTTSSGLKKASSGAAVPSSKAQGPEPTTTSALNDEDEVIVLPTPPKVVVSVNLVDSEEGEEEESTDEEDAKPSTTTAASRSTKENADSQQADDGERRLLTQNPPKKQRRASLRESGRRHSECAGTDSSDDSESHPANQGLEKEGARSAAGDSERPASRAKSATPTGGAAFASTAAASSTPLACHELRLPSLMTPPPLAVLPKPPLEQPATAVLAAAQLLSSSGRTPPPPLVVTKAEPPSPPQSHQGQAVDDLSSAAHGMAAGCPPPPAPLNPWEGSAPSTTPPVQLKGLVNELSVRCQQEDAIRHQLVELERSIASTLATLEELRRKKDELLVREVQVRKERLEILQCLQGAMSTVPASGVPLSTSSQQGTPEVDVPPSFNIGSAEGRFKVPPQEAPPTVSGQVPEGVHPPSSSTATPIAQDIAQLLLPYMRQFGDIDLSSLSWPPHPPASSSGGGSAPSSSMPTMSPEVSRGPSAAARKTTPKRKGRVGGEGPTTTRKRPRAAEAEIDDLRLEEIPSCQEISAHDLAIVAVKLHGHFVYSSSNDCSARRHDLLDPGQCVKYLGSTKTVNVLEVYSTKGRAAVLYTASLDGLLRSYDVETGECTDSFDIQAPVTCSALAWGKVYLGLQTGHVTVFNAKTRKLQDSFYCSNVPVHCMTTTTEGAQKLLCTVSLDGSVTVRDPSTGLLFRCLDGCVQPPCCILVNNGSVYTTSSDRTIRLHELRTGCLQKVYECKSSATGIHFQKGFIICCSFDGLIRFYRIKDFSCEMLYYGAGKNMVTSMDVSGPLIATGNRKGKLEVIKIDKSHLQTCEIRGCNLRFAREEDLLQHLRREHIGLAGAAAAAAAGGSRAAGGSMTCPWTQCQMSFSGPHCAKDFEKHLMDHACT